MGLTNSGNITIRSMAVSFKPQVERLLNEVEALLQTSGPSAEIKKKLVKFAGGITVFLADLEKEKTPLSSQQEEDLVNLQLKVRRVIDALGKKSSSEILAMIRKLREEAERVL